MLNLEIPEQEMFNETTGEFITVRKQVLTLEHSLLSVSKWESKTHKPFLASDDKTAAELKEYIRCMTVTPKTDPYIYDALDSRCMSQIRDYISDPMTATWFSDKDKKKNHLKKQKVMTAEIIYFLMISYNIPFECQKWHLNKLLTLIRVCEEKNELPKKMSPKELAKQSSALNAARRAKMGSRG